MPQANLFALLELSLLIEQHTSERKRRKNALVMNEYTDFLEEKIEIKPMWEKSSFTLTFWNSISSNNLYLVSESVMSEVDSIWYRFSQRIFFSQKTLHVKAFNIVEIPKKGCLFLLFFSPSMFSHTAVRLTVSDFPHSDISWLLASSLLFFLFLRSSQRMSEWEQFRRVAFSILMSR